MVDKAGQDLVEIEPAADVCGDPPEGVGPMELMRNLVGSSSGCGHHADGPADRHRQRVVDDLRVASRSPGDDEDAPWTLPPGNGNRDLALLGAEDSDGRGGDDRPRIATLGGVQGVSKRAEMSGQLDEMERARGRRPGHESLATQLEGSDSGEGAVSPDRSKRVGQGGVTADGCSGDPTELDEQREVRIPVGHRLS
jgi:hypothetical protein